ncbi:MAG: hypothetical protein AAGF77_07380, partial [Bacteroidota bacterium]
MGNRVNNAETGAPTDTFSEGAKAVQPYFPDIKDIREAAKTIAKVTKATPLDVSIRYSDQYGANVMLKR